MDAILSNTFSLHLLSFITQSAFVTNQVELVCVFSLYTYSLNQYIKTQKIRCTGNFCYTKNLIDNFVELLSCAAEQQSNRACLTLFFLQQRCSKVFDKSSQENICTVIYRCFSVKFLRLFRTASLQYACESLSLIYLNT